MCIIYYLLQPALVEEALVPEGKHYMVSSTPTKAKRKPPTGVSSPFPDEEIKRGEAPMMERAPPAHNGSGRYPPVIIKKQESEGYIVPMDEMMKKRQMEVEDTKL